MRFVATQGLASCCVACVYVIRCVELKTSLNKQNEAVSSFIIATASRYRDKASSHCHDASVISMQTSHGCQCACVKACKSCASSTLSYATIQTLRQRCRHAGVLYPIATCGVVTLSPPRLRMETMILTLRHDAASESLPVISSKVFTRQHDKSVPLSGVITLSRR